MFRISCIFLMLTHLIGQSLAQIQMPDAPSFNLSTVDIPDHEKYYVQVRSELINPTYPLNISNPNLLKWNSQESSFFCEIEYKINQASGVPFKFRLGSLSYVNKLEGKEMYEALPFPYMQKAGLRKKF